MFGSLIVSGELTRVLDYPRLHDPVFQTFFIVRLLHHPSSVIFACVGVGAASSLNAEI
jgi:hypothetical protein